MRGGRASVVLQRSNERVERRRRGADLIAVHAIGEAGAGVAIADEVVAKRDEITGEIGRVGIFICSDEGVLEFSGAIAVVIHAAAAELRAVADDGDAGGDEGIESKQKDPATAVGRDVTAQGDVGQRHAAAEGGQTTALAGRAVPGENGVDDDE